MHIVGIDEAGYGPLLGPLVMSRVEFNAVDTSSLSDALSELPYRITDSKILFKGRNTLSNLERPVHSLYPTSRTLKMYLDRIAYEDEPPFYSNDSLRLPICGDVEANGNFKGDKETEFCGAVSLYLTEERFNREYRKTMNKAELLFGMLKKHIRSVLKNTEDDVIFFIDRFGSRQYYGEHLWGILEDSPSAVRETRTSSEYLFRDGGRHILVRFSTDADVNEPVVSLSSIFSKYLRELFMICLCDYLSELFGERIRISGYHDRRTRLLLHNLKNILSKQGIEEEKLLRMA